MQVLGGEETSEVASGDAGRAAHIEDLKEGERKGKKKECECPFWYSISIGVHL